jgi:hypothetical protein|tara:strand:- start:189 stop:521 length:333 start_codon:yes stop_codon:yes gene_type:complete
MKIEIPTYWKIIIAIIVLFLIFNIVLYFGTNFTKDIKIKDKYIRYRRRGSNYNIVDSEGNIYQVNNVWFKGDFNRAEDYQLLEKGKTYNVTGYGIRIPMLDMYPNIYKIN